MTQENSPAGRLVTVLVTVSVPDAADPADAATLLAQAGQSLGLDVVHATGVERHLPVPGSTVLHGRRPRPWLVSTVPQGTAVITDLTGSTLQAPFRFLSPDPHTIDEAADPTET